MVSRQSSTVWGRVGIGGLGPLGVLLGLVGLSGCLIVEPLPPVGDEGSISGTWTIDDRVASAASCAAIGIDTVELSVYLRGQTRPAATFVGACATGSVDSRATSVFFQPGDYDVSFEAFRGASSVAVSGRTGIRLNANDHVPVTTNFASGTGFDPRGPDATAEATWTIDGRAPSSSACAALGVTDIRIAFQNGAAWYEHPDLVAPCSVGSIDTRPTPVILAGSWTMQVQALDAAGGIVAQGMMATLSVTPGSHVIMDPIDFTGGAFNPMGTDATVDGSWQLNTRMPTSDSCYAVGIDRVRVVLFAATDVAFENGVPVFQVQCSSGRIDSRPMSVIRAGTYLWALEAIDASGEIVTEYSEMTPITITPASHLELPLVDFMFPTTLTLGLEWQAPTGGAYTTCAAAGVATYSYTLRRDASIVATADVRPCQDLVSFNATDTGGFGPGNYALYFEGFNGAGRKQWSVLPATCDAIRVDNNGIVYDTCGASFTP